MTDLDGLEVGEERRFVTPKETFLARVEDLDSSVGIRLDPMYSPEVEEYSITDTGEVWEARYPSGDQVESDERSLGPLQAIEAPEGEQ